MDTKDNYEETVKKILKQLKTLIKKTKIKGMFLTTYGEDKYSHNIMFNDETKKSTEQQAKVLAKLVVVNNEIIERYYEYTGLERKISNENKTKLQ